MKIYVLVLAALATLLLVSGCAAETVETEVRFVEMPIATSVSQAEHDTQLATLRRFAGTLNQGGREVDDIVIVGIWNQYIPGSYRRVYFDTGRKPHRFNVRFMHVEDITDDIFSKMLAYTGIDEVDISMTAWFRPDNLFHDFLLENQAVRILAEPHLRLRSFARRINSGTTYYHELTITNIEDSALIFHEHYWGMQDGRTISVDGPPPFRFAVGLASLAHLEDDALIQEILHYIGLEANDVRFFHFPVGSSYIYETQQDFLLVNAEIYKLYNQFKRVNEFLDMHPNIDASVDAASCGRSPQSKLTIRFWGEQYLPDEELFADMLDFAGIGRDEIRVFVHRRGVFHPIF